MNRPVVGCVLIGRRHAKHGRSFCCAHFPPPCPPLPTSSGRAAAGARVAIAMSRPHGETTMLFQLRTDNHIPNSEDLAASVRADVEGALTRRYADRLRRIEVYLQDVNGHKGGVDTRCAIEAHL